MSLAALARFTVTTPADRGEGSLRAALIAANAAAGPARIEFAIGTGPCTIRPETPLPEILTPLTLDGWSQPGWGLLPLIEIDGSLCETGPGLFVVAPGLRLQGLAMTHWPDHGLYLGPGGGHVILGCHFGTDATGTLPRPNGRKPLVPGNTAGIYIDRSDDSRIGGPGPGFVLASGNIGYGILSRSGHRCSIVNCFVGTDRSGRHALPNSATGIWLQRAADCVIGSAAAAERVLVSGNLQYGVAFSGADASRNRLIGAFVGTCAQGRSALPNARTGVLVFNAPDTCLGGTGAGEGNVISGNLRAGINVDGSRFGNPPAPDSGAGLCRGTQILNNVIGLDHGGQAALPNGLAGVRLFQSQHTRVAGNLIGGNGTDGIVLHSLEDRSEAALVASDNCLEGNRIGLDAQGGPVPNGRHGIFVMGRRNRIGGATPESGNEIRHNAGRGLVLRGPDAAENPVSEHNRIEANRLSPQILRAG